MRSIVLLASACFVATLEQRRRRAESRGHRAPSAVRRPRRRTSRTSRWTSSTACARITCRASASPSSTTAAWCSPKATASPQFGGSKPVDSTTLFLAGSISKPVFSSGFLRVAEERKISLDADVNTLLKSWHLPESKFTDHEKVTPRRLLTHSAGLTVWGFPGYALDSAVPTVPQLLDGKPPANTPAVRNDTFPGARWLYSGGGITILQLATTDITGEDFPTLMRRLMLQPAGMTRSTYENPLPMNRRGEAASGHEQIDTPVPGGFHVYPEMAAAGLWTTPSDLARWAIALAHSYRGERGGVLSTTMARQMVSKQMHQQPPYGNGYWGLGVAVAGDGDSLHVLARRSRRRLRRRHVHAAGERARSRHHDERRRRRLDG